MVCALYYHWHVPTALVLSAGGMFGAWEVGVWKTLNHHFRPDCIVGASAGAWNGWMIAAGCSAEELTAAWLDPVNATIIPRAGVLRQMARELFAHFRPRVPFGLTVVEVPRMRVRLVRDSEITWQHLAAACSIPLLFPPVRIDGASYVDGGLLGTLPLWAATDMGATRAIAVNAHAAPPFRALRWALPPRRPSPTIEIVRIEPPTPLGSMTDAVRWSRASTLRLIEQGERDATRVCTSITM